jgi:hypothetical protein
MSLQISNFACTLVQTAEFLMSIVYRPQSVVDLFEADVLMDEDRADVQKTVLPADAPAGGDASDLEVSRVLEGWQTVGEGSG